MDERKKKSIALRVSERRRNSKKRTRLFLSLTDSYNVRFEFYRCASCSYSFSTYSKTFLFYRSFASNVARVALTKRRGSPTRLLSKINYGYWRIIL